MWDQMWRATMPYVWIWISICEFNRAGKDWPFKQSVPLIWLFGIALVRYGMSLSGPFLAGKAKRSFRSIVLRLGSLVSVLR